MSVSGGADRVPMTHQPPVLPDASLSGERSSVRWLWLSLGLLLGLGLVLIHTFSPLQYGFYPRCGLFVVTGLHCPGCGSLRAMHHLTHGEVVAAMGANCLLILGLGLAVVWGAARLWRGRPFAWQVTLLGAKGVVAMMGLVVLFGVLRNLPWEPFAWLAP